MSRSRRYTPIWKDRMPYLKWRARKRYRHACKYAIKNCVDYEELLIPLVREITCVYEWSDYWFWIDFNSEYYKPYFYMKK